MSNRKGFGFRREYKQTQRHCSRATRIYFILWNTNMTESTNNFPVFKKATLEDSSIGTKKRAWKSLKQILAVERTLQWPENAVTCK